MDGSQVSDSTSVVYLKTRAESVRDMRSDSVDGSKGKLQWDLVYLVEKNERLRVRERVVCRADLSQGCEPWVQATSTLFSVKRYSV